MRFYVTASEPHCAVLEETGFHLVFLTTPSEPDEPTIRIAAYPPGQEYPFGERDVVSDIAGCLGILRYRGRNLLVLAELPLETVGLEAEVRRIKRVTFFDLDECRPVSLSLSALAHLLESGHYYTSKSFDLTKRVEDRIKDDLQRAEACRPQSRIVETKTTAPCPHHFGLPGYVWNAHLLAPFFELRQSLDHKVKTWFDARSFALPIIEGFYEQQRIDLERGDRITVTVISRHGRERDGTRFEKRGIDSTGNVAQFVETETILESDTATVSFVQVRGSVPLYWSERPSSTSVDLKILDPPSRSLPPFLTHFRSLAARFGSIHIFSLLHNHDTTCTHPEQSLSDAYEQLAVLAQDEPDLRTDLSYQQHSLGLAKLPDIPRGIVNSVSSLIDDVGVTRAAFDPRTGKLSIEKKQNGIFRVNCRDCCDRTTLGQWSIAVEAVRREMLDMGLDDEAQARVEKALGELWADNGDAVSSIYTGANALFTRFIRTGHYSPGLQAYENFEAMEKRLSQHYMGDKEKNRAIEILTGTWTEQELPPKLLLVSPTADPLVSRFQPSMNEDTETDSEVSALSDSEISQSRSALCLQKAHFP
ncbi:hypothetical protein JCM11491_006915 [Sporobolomyces phaffii]